jgi:hypothetical protein
MSRATEVVWDGEFIQNMPAAEAATKQAAGEVQIWEGTQGYQPGWQMKDSSEFPFVVAPPLVQPVVVPPPAPDEDE